MIQKQLARASLGVRGLTVSRLCLGALTFGDETDECEAEEIIALYRQAGGNFIDVSGDDAGLPEQVVGNALQKHTGSWIIAAKAGDAINANSASTGAITRWLRQTVETSLDRLGIEQIDLYYLPLDDQRIGLEEAVEALGGIIEAGKIGSWGFCNLRAWRIAELIRIADCLDVPRPIAMQPYYHALHRLAETDYLPACAHFGIGVVPSMPPDGDFHREMPVNGARFSSYAAASNAPVLKTELQPVLFKAIDAVADHLRPSGRAMAGFALQWVLANRLISSVLIQPKSIKQLEAHLAAAAAPYTTEDELFVNELVPAGNVLGSAYGDPEAAKGGRIVG